MADSWEDDEWDKEPSIPSAPAAASSAKKESSWEDEGEEEDLALQERAAVAARDAAELKDKGGALAKKKAAEAAKALEEEVARKAMALEAELERNMTFEERKAKERKQIEDADAENINDLFGGVDSGVGPGAGGGKASAAGDKVVLKDLKDVLTHAKKVGEAIRAQGSVVTALAFLKEVVSECKDVLDDDSITQLIAACNVVKNDKLAAAKKKSAVKGQAQKSKDDKVAKAAAKKKANDLYGDSDKYDAVDDYGTRYEDSFF